MKLEKLRKMIKFKTPLKILLLLVFTFFTIALINPAKAMYITTITASYSYIAVLEIGNALITATMNLREYLNV